ncbi:MAG: ATP synthase F1 subunit epsilon [Armatimonadota bacterium]
MAAATYRLDVATQERVIFSDEIVSLVAPSVEGQLGILARHAPLIAELGIGQLKIRYADDARELLLVAGGIMEVSGQGVIVLADIAERPEEIDLERAEQALARARARLTGGGPEAHVDIARARAALMRALNRLRVARRR